MMSGKRRVPICCRADADLCVGICIHVCVCVRACVQESKKDASLTVASHKTLEYGQVILSTDNIFNRCRSRSKIGYPPESHPLHQLDVIGNFVSDLAAITRQHKQEQGKKTAKAQDA